MKMRALVLVLFSAAASHWCVAQTAAPYNGPIIDMHLHALHANGLGPPPVFICAPNPSWPTRDAKTPGEQYGETFIKNPPCASPLRSPLTDDELIRRTVAIMKARNVTAITSGNTEADPLGLLGKWKLQGGDRILPAVPFDPRSGKSSPHLACCPESIT